VTIPAPRTTASGHQGAPLGEIAALTGLRIVAALWVVAFHFHFTALPGVTVVTAVLGPLVTHGELGVDLFFVLSGFVIAHTHLDRLGPALRAAAAARFLRARLARMWPAYAVVFHLFGLWLIARLVFGHDRDVAFQAVQPGVNLGQWLQQLFLVQMWDNAYLDGASWVGPTWSLSAEWLAYLLFPVAALGFWRLRHLPAPLLAAVAVVLMTPLAGAYVLHGSPYYPYSWLVRIACAFSAGALTCLALRRARRTAALRRRASALAATLPVLVAAGLLAGERVRPGAGGVVIVLFPLLVGALALADRGPATLLARPALVAGGRISYCLYLVHIPMFELFWLALQHRVVEGRVAYLVGIAVLVATLPVAALLHRLVEEPARRRLLGSGGAVGARAAVVQEAVGAAEAVHAARALPRPRHAASADRRPTLAGVLVDVQGRRPTHRAHLHADLDRSIFLRSGRLASPDHG
jgi:peptidoglycan/LPS O-acetylase OafA/YrhL